MGNEKSIGVGLNQNSGEKLPSSRTNRPSQSVREMKSTVARFLMYQGLTFIDEAKQIAHGYYDLGDLLVRLDENGLLHGQDEPAIQTENGHLEWWNHGVLHRMDAPAVLSSYGEYQERWENGRRIG